MRLIGRSEVITIEEPDHLEFVVVREKGWVGLFVPPLIALIIAAVTWITHHYFFSMLVFLTGIFALIKSSDGSDTRLFVYQNQLIARGNVSRAFSGEVKVRTSDVKSIGYRMGGEDSPSGLYAKQSRLKQTCLVPGLDKRLSNAIADAISRKFPNISRES